MGYDIPIKSLSFADIMSSGMDMSYEEAESMVTTKSLCLTTGKLLSDQSVAAVVAARNVRVYNKAGEKLTLTELNTLLWSIGMNIRDNHFKVTKKHKHRACCSKLPVHDFKFTCPERLDRVWVDGKLASDEAKMASSQMEDMGSVAHSLKNGNYGDY